MEYLKKHCNKKWKKLLQPIVLSVIVFNFFYSKSKLVVKNASDETRIWEKKCSLCEKMALITMEKEASSKVNYFISLNGMQKNISG